MLTFTRLAGFAFVLLSLSFLVSAIPVVTRTYTSICAPSGNDAVSLLFINFRADIEAKIHALRKSFFCSLSELY